MFTVSILLRAKFNPLHYCPPLSLSLSLFSLVSPNLIPSLRFLTATNLRLSWMWISSSSCA